MLLLHLCPDSLIHPFIQKREPRVWHGVATAALGAGHRCGVGRGIPLDVEALEGVAAVVAFEYGCSS